jgi:hypothetical protein
VAIHGSFTVDPEPMAAACPRGEVTDVFGSWLCKNAETDALMGRNLVAVAMDLNFSGLAAFSVWKRADATAVGLGLLCDSRRGQASDNG